MAPAAAVLGLHVGLNSSVALVALDDGRLVYAEQEERFTRTKNHCGFPHEALRAALRHATESDLSIEAVGVGGATVFPHDRSRAQLLDAYRRVHDSLRLGVDDEPTGPAIDDAQGFVRAQLASLLALNCPVTFFDHHVCHASAAYYFLRADDRPYLVVTLDGEGDRLAGTVSVARGGDIERIATTDCGASAGLLYFWVTYLLGFTPHEDEHKVMGLAGYADPDASAALAEDIFGDLLAVDDDTLALHAPAAADPWMQRLVQRCRGVRFDHLAGALQAHVESLAAGLVASAIAKTGVRDVLVSGGLFMNVKVNQAIRHHPAVGTVDAMPSAGDESLSIGAAYLACVDLAGSAPPASPSHLYLGSDLRAADLDNAARRATRAGCRIIASELASATEAAAEALLGGEPVGVCVGRAEFGARALGHRSILVDPSCSGAVDRLNTAIKQRDFWMPFAPVMLYSQACELLTDIGQRPVPGRISPWMMHAYSARREERLRGAVHPGDWTCRPQTLADTSDEPVADLLRIMADRGQPALVNTSLNVHGSPIARTAADAVDVLVTTPLRHLLLDDRLIEAPRG